MEKTVKLIFSGQIQPGRDLAEVKAGLPEVMKIPPDQVERLFIGKPVVIKRGLPVSKLPAYQELLFKAGILVEVENEPYEHVLDLEPQHPADPVSDLPVERMTCPQCGAAQPKRTLCQECGVDMPRFAAAQEALRTESYSQPVSAQSVYTAASGVPYEEVPPILGFSFDGRLNRIRYLIYSLAAYAVMILATLIVVGSMSHSMFLGDFPVFTIVPMLFVGLAIVFLGLRYSVQRLHDMNLTGWLILLSFVPVLGGLVWIWLSVWPGSKEDNDYGAANPPNSVIQQAIVLGLVLVLVLLLGVGFKKAMRAQDEMRINRAEQMQMAPHGNAGEGMPLQQF